MSGGLTDREDHKVCYFIMNCKNDVNILESLNTTGEEFAED